MAATVYGGNAQYGLSDEATASGMYIQSLTLDASEEEVFVADHVGDDQVLAMFNNQATLTGTGVLTTAHTLGGTAAIAVGADLGSIANAAIFGTESDVTVLYVTSVNLTSSNRDFQTGSFTAIGRAGITDTIATEVT